MIPLESLRLVDGDQIDGSLLVTDNVRGLDTDIIFLDHRDEQGSIWEHQEWFLFLVVADLVGQLRYISEGSRLELILIRYCTIIIR